MADISEALYVGVAGDAPRTPPARIALGDVDRVDIGRTVEARSIKRGTGDAARTVTLALPDPRMSTNHARLTRSGDGWVIEDLGSMNGTTIGALRIKKRPLDDGDVIQVGHTALMFFESGGEGGDLDGMPPAIAPGLATLSPALLERYRDLAAAAPGDQLIEINGEPGTGSELAAFATHVLSKRSGQFATLNCGQFHGTEVVQALEQAFAAALEGTVFLDEVHLLAREAQAPLAKMIEGASARVISSSSRDLDVEVSVDNFDADLRARLRGFSIALLPLRRRREDLGLLVAALLDIHAKKRTVTFSGEAVGALYVHDWPLNIRELERSLVAALAVATDRIEMQHLPASVGATEPLQQPVFREVTAEERSLREQLTTALARHEGNIAAVGREMGKDPTQIRRWMKKFNLKRE
jgi:hypothetical protein